MYGEQERLYRKEIVLIKNIEVETYVHNNGIIIVPNTEDNCKAMKTIEIPDIQKLYTILDHEKEEPATTNYKKALYILKKKSRSSKGKGKQKETS